MGCFNMKCALTQLPVTYGDEVVVLFGVRPGRDEQMGDYAGGFRYQPHYFKLIAPPLFGDYNDYGWIENTDKYALSCFVKFLQAVGFEGVEAATIKNGVEEEMLEAVREGMRKAGRHDADEIELDYTFVHRKAWDNLVEAGRDKIHHHHVSLKLSQDQIAELKNNLVDFGIKDATIGEHGALNWLTADATHPTLFKMAVALLPASLGSFSDEVDFPDNFESLPPEEQAIIATKVTKAMRESLNYNDSVAHWLMSTLDWFRPLHRKSGTLRGAKPYAEEVVAVLKEAQTDKDFYQCLEDVHVMFQALLDNMIVIRSSSDLPSQSQDSTYWGHIALTRAMGEIIHQRAVELMDEMTEDEDEDTVIHSQDVIENLMLSELKSEY